MMTISLHTDFCDVLYYIHTVWASKLLWILLWTFIFTVNGRICDLFYRWLLVFWSLMNRLIEFNTNGWSLFDGCDVIFRKWINLMIFCILSDRLIRQIKLYYIFMSTASLGSFGFASALLETKVPRILELWINRYR